MLLVQWVCREHGPCPTKPAICLLRAPESSQERRQYILYPHSYPSQDARQDRAWNHSDMEYLTPFEREAFYALRGEHKCHEFIQVPCHGKEPSHELCHHPIPLEVWALDGDLRKTPHSLHDNRKK